MSDARTEVLRRIRHALAQPLGAGAPEPAQLTYAPSFAGPAPGESLADRFTRALEAVGGQVHRLHSRQEWMPRLRALVAERGFRRIAVVQSGLLQQTDVVCLLREMGREVRSDADWRQPEHAATLRSWLDEADLCLSGADYALAETGTLVMQTRPGQPRAATLLPPVHLAIVGEEQIEPAFETLVPKLKETWGSTPSAFGSALTLITGPSRSADIEQTLTLGVHGPVEVMVMLLPPTERRG